MSLKGSVVAYIPSATGGNYKVRIPAKLVATHDQLCRSMGMTADERNSKKEICVVQCRGEFPIILQRDFSSVQV